MKQHIKQWMKKRLTDRQVKQYDRLLERKTVTYDAWIRDVEKLWTTADLQVRYIPYEACRDYVTGTAMQSDEAQVVLFFQDEGEVSGIAEQVVAHFFTAHEEVDLAYGDEDVMSPEGIRYTPWLKPDWSPDTFLSFFYFGSVFAVRMKALRALTAEEKQWIWQLGERSGIYRLCYVLAAKSGGFEKRDAGACKEKVGKVGIRKKSTGFPIGHMDEILFHSKVNRELELEHSDRIDLEGCPVMVPDVESCRMVKEAEKDAKPVEILVQGKVQGAAVSVIIPSKDNPEILKQCITSLQKATRVAHEVIVVDNGSVDGVKQELEAWLRAQGGNYRYIYQPMPFHFSKMCNLGAEAASGKVLLFLNDDVEIPEVKQDFLQTLYQKASRSFTGAVGVKLYYPGGCRMQHAGIVNLGLGPVHKLQFKEDDHSYYYGWNRRERNVIAVTGACLAVEREKFEEIGGFPVELPVAFNDVDVCFSLYEKGYYNVVLQDISLFHHESLSRGNDDDRKKLNRLLGEKDKLYERHPGLLGYDPFYHKYFANEMLSTGFELRSDYDDRPQNAKGTVQNTKGLLANARQDACVIISLEYAGSVRTESEGRKRYLLQGYSFITGSDNACFEKYVIFRPDTDTEDGAETIWYVKAEPYIRKDVEVNLPDQVHVGMTGFNMELADGELPVGDCRVGVMVKDKCSGQKIYAWTNRYLTVE